MGFQCEVPDVRLRELIAKVAHENGRRDGKVATALCEYAVIICDDRGQFVGNDKLFSAHETIDFLTMWKIATTPLVKPIIITSSNGAKYTIEFPNNYDGIKVGCTSIPTATVDEIYKRLHEAK